MADSRTALARTYRPRRFADVATQAHVAETLRAAVARGRVAHAYLFCGPRGVGKTTAARVLAMALNCPNRGEDGEPCGVCESCERIWSGKTSLDVIEIDAASNRGVDDMRDLRERAQYAPTDERRYKVYIIDEAHMLTREAWNTLLKTLEEPPPRVIFVFATTEPQKIQQAAPPILSRCQRFDFRRIPVSAILERLREIVAKEGIEIGDEALLPIARRAEGGLRDALSLLDQVLSFAGGTIDATDVQRVLGLVTDELYIELFEILADKRHGDVFRFVQRMLDEGFDLTEFYRGLADALRLLLATRFDGKVPEDVREDLAPAWQRLAERFGTGDLLRMLTLVAELDVEGRFRKSAHPRTMLEALLLRFAYLDRTVDIETLIAEGGLATDDGAPPAPTRRGGASGSATRSGPAASSAAARPVPSRPAASSTTAPPTGRPAERPAREPARRAAVEEGDEASQAMRRLLQQKRGVPAGMSLVLSTAAVRLEGGDRVALELPAGLFRERLGPDSPERRTLEAALSEEMGRKVRLEVLEAGAGPQDRLTPERVRAEQLARMTRADPALGSAVESWDLELFE